MRREKISKFLGVYANILLAVFGLTLIMSSIIMMSSGQPTCYTEPLYDDVIYQDKDLLITNYTEETDNEDCIMVKDTKELVEKLNRYKWISVICMAGIFGIKIYKKKRRERR